ncbi:MAG TPA: CRISPR-associated RAMP protein Csx7 [Chloroflexota bacterium]
MERLQGRWSFNGVLQATSGLHVGAGMGNLLAADSAVLRDAGGRPYLPATTLKGALRASVDRLAPVVGAERGLTACGMSPREESCPSPVGSAAYRAVESALREFRGTPQERDEQLLQLLEERLCSTCRLFGSPWLAGRLSFADAPPSGDYDVPVEIRDGIGIDRDSGVARETSHFSYEALPSHLNFDFRLDAQNLDEADQALLAIGLSEWQHGNLRLGGGNGRGLGHSRLNLQSVGTITFASAPVDARLDYLLHGTLPQVAPDAWLATALAWLFQSRNETAGA